MKTLFRTNNKNYVMNVDKYICNRFGLAEFLALHNKIIDIKVGEKVLDAGCGACPIAIFLADQYKCFVSGVELNKIACNCATQNIIRYNLDGQIEVINKNLKDYTETYSNIQFDAIVSNPPIDENISNKLISKYGSFDYKILNDESYAYLTNSWHSEDGQDMLDYIFQFASKYLRRNGCIYIVFCTYDCSKNYVVNKGLKYNFYVNKFVEDYINIDDLGIKLPHKKKILTYIMKFKRGK